MNSPSFKNRDHNQNFAPSHQMPDASPQKVYNSHRLSADSPRNFSLAFQGLNSSHELNIKDQHCESNHLLSRDQQISLEDQASQYRSRDIPSASVHQIPQLRQPQENQRPSSPPQKEIPVKYDPSPRYKGRISSPVKGYKSPQNRNFISPKKNRNSSPRKYAFYRSKHNTSHTAEPVASPRVEELQESNSSEESQFAIQQLRRFLHFLNESTEELLNQKFSSIAEEVHGKTFLLQTINEMARFFIHSETHQNLLQITHLYDMPQNNYVSQGDISPPRNVHHGNHILPPIGDEIEVRNSTTWNMESTLQQGSTASNLRNTILHQQMEIYHLQNKVHELAFKVKEQALLLHEKDIEGEMNTERKQKEISYHVSHFHGDSAFEDSFIVPDFSKSSKKAPDYFPSETIDNEKFRRLREKTSNSNALFAGSLRLFHSPRIKLEPKQTSIPEKRSTPKSNEKVRRENIIPQTIKITLPPPEVLPYANPSNIQNL